MFHWFIRLSVMLVSVPLVFCNSPGGKMRDGYELDPASEAGFLGKRLSEDFGYAGFKPAWLRKAWVNGFRDHIYLFVISADSPDLRQAIETVTGTEPDALLRNGQYLGPSTPPPWWNTKSIDDAESRYLRKDGRTWRFTWMDGVLYVVLVET
jgi:hypothetical protein